MPTSRGLDVSSYQGTQDWKALARNGLTFAFAKATEGEHTTDSRFVNHIGGIIAAGLVPGAYHFGWPTQSPATEAANYIAAVRPHAGRGFVHVLDLERRSDGANYAGRTATQIQIWAHAWISYVQQAFPGQRVGVYTSADDIAAKHVPANAGFLWYPAYPSGEMSYAEAEDHPRPLPSGQHPLFWQFTSTPLDRDLAYLSPAALRAWAAGGDGDGEQTDHQEDDMPDVKDLWGYKGTAPGGKGTDPHDAYAYLRGTNADVRTVLTRLDTLSKTVAAQTATITKLVALVGTGDDAKTAAALHELAGALRDVVTAAHDDDQDGGAGDGQ